jgi:ferrous iron transport protein A
MRTLDKLLPGQKGVILKFDIVNIPMKLIEMGCLPGNKVEALYFASYNDPIYLKLDDTYIAIRKDLASNIFIDLEI